MASRLLPGEVLELARRRRPWPVRAAAWCAAGAALVVFVWLAGRFG